jgi:hypothetical protein
MLYTLSVFNPKLFLTSCRKLEIFLGWTPLYLMMFQDRSLLGRLNVDPTEGSKVTES